MQNYVITTDTGTDFDRAYAAEHGIDYLTMPLVIDKVDYPKGAQPDCKEFYRMLRAGAYASTSMANVEEAREMFEKYLAEGKGVLHICLSSGLSGTYENLKKLAEELNAEIGEEKIIVIDSLTASGGPGLQLIKAVENKEAGMSLEDNAAWLTDHAIKTRQYFLVDELSCLVRGGRISKFSGLLGTTLKIKPVLHLTAEGKIVPYDKTIGTKQAVKKLISYVERDFNPEDNDRLVISHADAFDFAKSVGDVLEKDLGMKATYLEMSPTIGAHTGPGCISVFFFGAPRKDK